MKQIEELYFKIFYVGSEKIIDTNVRRSHILASHTYLICSIAFLFLAFQSFVFGVFDLGTIQVFISFFCGVFYFLQRKRTYKVWQLNFLFFSVSLLLYLNDLFHNILDSNFVFLGVLFITMILVLFRLHKKSLIFQIVFLLSTQTFAFFSDARIRLFDIDPNYSNFLLLSNVLLTSILFIIIMTIFMSLWQMSQDQLENKITEKEVLLAEVNHRVRNNLNVIISLMKLQQANMESEEVYEALEESKLRVYSMASVHNKLYANNDLNNISLSEYVEDLAKDLQCSSNPNVVISIKSGNINLNVDKAIPLGLILNELFTNSFKHAFPNKINGKISLSIDEFGDTLNISYKDNGKNFKIENLRKNPNSLGVTLIESLSEQLDGTLNISEEQGFKFNLIFPYLV